MGSNPTTTDGEFDRTHLHAGARFGPPLFTARSYIRSRGPKKGHFSRVTVQVLVCLSQNPRTVTTPWVDLSHQHPLGSTPRQVYLHDVPEEFGGATTFLERHGPPLPCQPRAGSVLIFSQVGVARRIAREAVHGWCRWSRRGERHMTHLIVFVCAGHP